MDIFAEGVNCALYKINKTGNPLGIFFLKKRREKGTQTGPLQLSALCHIFQSSRRWVKT